MSTPEPLRDAITRAMADEVESRTEWDEMPELWRINLHDGQPVLRRIEVPPHLWTLARPPEVLEEIASAVVTLHYYPGQQEDDAEDGPAYGFGLLHEGWAIQSDSMCGSERDAADAAAHRLHTRPDRVEVRMFTAVDRDQTVYAVMKSRGGEMDQVLTSSADNITGLGGAIFDALTKLVKGILPG